MKVYIVMPFYPYEGYGEPEGVFLDKKKAEDFRSELNKRYYADHEILERDVK